MDDSIEVERIRYARAYILEILRGYLMLDKSRNLIHLRWLLKLVDFRAVGELIWGSTMLWNHSMSYEGIPTALEDIRLLLDQWSEAYGPIDQLRYRRDASDGQSVAAIQILKIDSSELAYESDYMPWFRIHGKAYLLSKAQRHWQFRVKKE
ncbi:hypothetical protein Godav_009875 [Gossypium davidsonii]|uniref:Uncharacterized protein n=1 Tax=Gossypium davidsonii TaxID=34287 RepID=A0A7J8SEI7_GOSDV|nr:hypothetical protein [Gossypium davidsonii]